MKDDSDRAPLEYQASRFDAPYDPGLDRRQNPDPLKEYLKHKFEGMEERLTKHLDTRFAAMQKHFDKRFEDAFPEGDPHGHRMYHERSIADADKWARVKSAVTEKLISGGVWLLLAFVVLAVWEAFKAEVKK